MSAKPPRRVRAADVAAAAGVSPTAVSFVLNGRDSGNIAPDTKARILAAAEELGYQPNHLAKSLRSQKTFSLGLVTDAVATSVFGGRLLAAATDAAAEAGYATLLMDLLDREGTVCDAIRELQRRHVDALIYVSMGYRVLPSAPTAHSPLVLANCTTEDGYEPAVYPDDAAGARVALEHLAELGHRRITMLSGFWDPEHPGLHGANVSGPIRRDAFVAAAQQRGLEARVIEGGWGIDDGYRSATAALDVDPRERPTALFAITDRAALGAVLAAARLGLRVPEGISIIGFDDEDKLADKCVPPLTTVALPHASMGERAVKMALGLLGEINAEANCVALPCKLVVRGSTAPPSGLTRR